MKIPAKKSTPDTTINDVRGAVLFDRYGDVPALVAGGSAPCGASFYIPVLVPVGTPTGDGRKFLPDSLSARDLPLPLMWQFKSSQGHDQSVLVGRIDSIEVNENGIKNVRGVFDTGPYGREAERLVRGGFLTGVSADMDNFSGEEDEDDLIHLTPEKKRKNQIKNRKININQARLAGATLVNIPAFQRSKIYLDEEFRPMSNEEYQLMDGEYSSDDMDQSLVASAFPVAPPRAWFSAPDTATPGPLEISAEGQVYGYLALWESTHIGYGNKKVQPPRSSSKYKYFRTGKVLCDDGTEVNTGSLTLVGGHAPLNFSAPQAAKHYDDTNSAVVDVTVGEDRFGIWVAGAVRPDVSPSQIRSMRGSGISGDWRPIHGKLELVRACFVNTPGFMTTRAMVAGGQIQALVAAGTHTLDNLRMESAFSEHLGEFMSSVEDRMFLMENKERIDETVAKLSALKEETSRRKAEQEQEMDSKVADLKSKFGL